MADPADRARQRLVPTLAAIARVFARHANTTFGGGSATIAVLRRQLVVRQAWLDDTEFDLGYALSRLTPGTNLLAFCTAAGWTARRWPGAVIALLAASLPYSILAVVVTVFDTLWILGGAAAASFAAALLGVA
jgi:chromate transporter